MLIEFRNPFSVGLDIPKSAIQLNMKWIEDGSYLATPKGGLLNCSFRMEYFARVPSPFVGFRVSLRHVYDGSYK